MVLVSPWLLAITSVSLQSRLLWTRYQLALPLFVTILLLSVSISSLGTLESVCLNHRPPVARGTEAACVRARSPFPRRELWVPVPLLKATACTAPLCPSDRTCWVPSCVPGSLLDSGVQMWNQAYKVPAIIELIFSVEILSLSCISVPNAINALKHFPSLKILLP